jgi:hypothetical protein
MEGHEMVAREPPHRLHRALARARVRVARVEQRGQLAPGHHLGALLRPLERRLDVGDAAPHLFLGKGRREQHLGQQVEAEGEVLLEDVE